MFWGHHDADVTSLHCIWQTDGIHPTIFISLFSCCLTVYWRYFLFFSLFTLSFHLFFQVFIFSFYQFISIFFPLFFLLRPLSFSISFFLSLCLSLSLSHTHKLTNTHCQHTLYIVIQYHFGAIAMQIVACPLMNPEPDRASFAPVILHQQPSKRALSLWDYPKGWLQRFIW